MSPWRAPPIPLPPKAVQPLLVGEEEGLGGKRYRIFCLSDYLSCVDFVWGLYNLYGVCMEFVEFVWSLYGVVEFA